MTQEEILGIFKNSGALLEGHFVLSSGLHSEKYLQCALILQEPELASRVCEELAKRFRENKPTVVMGPALGGIIVAYEVAKALGCRPVRNGISNGARAIFAERQDGKLALRRGFSISAQDRVLVVEDVVTTGGSTNEVIALVKDTGAALVGVGAIVDRSAGKAAFPAKFQALLTINVETFQPDNCPLCKAGVPAAKPGSRS